MGILIFNMAYLCSLAGCSDSPSSVPRYHAHLRSAGRVPSPDFRWKWREIKKKKKKKEKPRIAAFVSISHFYRNASENPKAWTNKRAARTERRRCRERRLQRYICTLIRMTECTRSHNAQQDYSIVSNFALYYSEHCVCVWLCRCVCSAHAC